MAVSKAVVEAGVARGIIGRPSFSRVRLASSKTEGVCHRSYNVPGVFEGGFRVRSDVS